MDKRRENFMKKLLCLCLIFISCLAQTAPPQWIDIPGDDCVEISNFKNEVFENFNKSVAKYHSIPKNLEKHLKDRVEALEDVLKVISELLISISDTQEKKFLENIQVIARNKQSYINSLELIAQQGLYRQDKLEEYHFDITSLEGNYQPIFLFNQRMYDSLNGQYWGEYWMETLDPAHRQLTPYYELFRKKKEKEPSLLEFFLWLEDQNLSKDVPYLIFLNDFELDKLVITVQNGLLYSNDALHLELIDYCDPEIEYIFNINLKGQLILTPATKTIHHVSLSHSKPVLGCGNMIVKKGQVVNIELESGHYLPSIDNGFQTLQIFHKLGIFLDSNTPFTYYHLGKRHKSTVGNFLSIFSSEYKDI